jgi:hypothetical protein
MYTVSFDLSGMNRLLGAIQGALIFNGEEADARVLTKQEARLLAWEISRKLGPKNQAKAKKGIERDVKKQFAALPSNAFDDEKAGGNIGVRWLYAGPNYLVGVSNGDYFPDAQPSAMEAIYNANGRGNSDRGQKRFVIDAKRGRQTVSIVNRIMVKRARLNGFISRLVGRVGRMRATFAYTANILGQKRIPGWVARHFQSVSADGKAIFNQEHLNHPTAPYIEFGSRAPGIHHFEEAIEEAIRIRERRMAKRLRLILEGYAKDHAAGQSPRRHVRETEEGEE